MFANTFSAFFNSAPAAAAAAELHSHSCCSEDDATMKTFSTTPYCAVADSEDTNEPSTPTKEAAQPSRSKALTNALAMLLCLCAPSGAHRCYLGDVPGGLFYFVTGDVCFVGAALDAMHMDELVALANEKKPLPLLATEKALAAAWQAKPAGQTMN